MLKKSLPLNYTFLLDASGSMGTDAQEVRQELNAQIKELKMRYEELKRPCQVSLHLFNRQVTTLRKDIPIQNLQEIERNEYEPWGCTALLDAMGYTLEDLNDRLGKKVQKKKVEVVLVVFTDGRENVSKTYKKERVHSLLKDLQETEGWTISLVGTDWEGISEGKQIGIQKKHAHYYLENEKLKAMKDIRTSIARFYGQEVCAFRIQRKGEHETMKLDTIKASNT